MTSNQRFTILVVILICSAALAVVTILNDASSVVGAVAGFTGISGTALGYAFGDRNGEKRLAAAIVQTAADGGDTLQQAHDISTPGVTP